MNKEEIQSLDPSDIAKFAELDSAGILAGPGENAGKFKERALKLISSLDEINTELSEKGKTDLVDSIPLKKEDRINTEILEEATEINKRFYDFSINWVPGFFLSKSLGIFWGGCAISFEESQFTIFLIRASFAKQKKWFLYRRDELLSHELCHIARMPIGDKLYEEFFAYRSSPSGFRRYFGSCFRTQADSLIFVIPIFLLLIMQILITFSVIKIPIYPFWILAVLFPLYLLTKNQILRKIAFRAIGKLESFGILKAKAILFRCTAREISEISGMNNVEEFSKWVSEMETREIRWKIIRWKYFGKANKS